MNIPVVKLHDFPCYFIRSLQLPCSILEDSFLICCLTKSMMTLWETQATEKSNLLELWLAVPANNPANIQHQLPPWVWVIWDIQHQLQFDCDCRWNPEWLLPTWAQSILRTVRGNSYFLPEQNDKIPYFSVMLCYTEITMSKLVCKYYNTK